jgi:beta-lactamase regulating signal transducer with metallopeptidase domain
MTLWMLLLNTTVKVSLIVFVALATTTLLRRRSAAVRHFVLAVALACAAATPVVRLVAPAWQSSAGWFPGLTTSRIQLIDRPLALLDDSMPSTASGAVRAPASSALAAASVLRAFGIIWMFGAGLAALVLLTGLSRLSWIAARAQRITSGPWADAAADIARAYGLRRTPVVLESDGTAVLGTWGVARSKILLPADVRDWPADRVRIVLAHELAHVRRGDWLVQMAAELLCALYWFNPLVWLASRRLRLESEQACDDAVLTLGVEGSAYASELVDLARAFKSDRQLFVPAVAIARPSSLERRVRAMLNVKLNRDPITRTASIAAALVLAVVTVLVAGFGVSAQTPFATVSGSVVDPKGMSLASVTLTLSNTQSQSKYEIKSDANGHFEFVGLAAGNYTLLYEFPGFAFLKREGIVLSGQTFESNAVLQVGSIQETITVTDEAPTPQQQAAFAVRARAVPGPRFNPCKNNPRGGCIAPPAKIKDVRPIYPAGAPAGHVEVAAVIGTDGRVASVDVVGNGNGGPADLSLADAAAAAVREWEFTPTLLDGDPIDVRMKVNVTFIAATH